MEFKIINGRPEIIEFAWINIEINHGNKIYELQFYTEEIPGKSEFSRIEFTHNGIIKIAKQINFEITKEFKKELYQYWQNYSNLKFR